MKTLIVYVLAILAVEGNAADYCDKKLNCTSKRHIACNNKKAFACKDGKLIDLKPYVKDIVQQHNEKRNLIASGKLRVFKSAEVMATMQWNNELAELAELNVKQCKMEYDCHNTAKFPYSGQNLGMQMYSVSATPRPIKPLLHDQIEMWWNQNKNSNMNQITKLPTNYKVFQGIRHFTAMVSDKNTHVGCALSKYTNKQNGGTWDTYLLACNYGSANFQPIYKPGRAASGCKSGRNAKYQNLCSIKEKFPDF